MFIFIVLFISCYYFFEILKIFHVPGCSGMFHVPDFIDALLKPNFAVHQVNLSITKGPLQLGLRPSSENVCCSLVQN